VEEDERAAEEKGNIGDDTKEMRPRLRDSRGRYQTHSINVRKRDSRKKTSDHETDTTKADAERKLEEARENMEDWSSCARLCDRMHEKRMAIVTLDNEWRENQKRYVTQELETQAAVQHVALSEQLELLASTDRLRTEWRRHLTVESKSKRVRNAFESAETAAIAEYIAIRDALSTDVVDSIPDDEWRQLTKQWRQLAPVHALRLDNPRRYSGRKDYRERAIVERAVIEQELGLDAGKPNTRSTLTKAMLERVAEISSLELEIRVRTLQWKQTVDEIERRQAEIVSVTEVHRQKRASLDAEIVDLQRQLADYNILFAEEDRPDLRTDRFRWVLRQAGAAIRNYRALLATSH
jgi:hypothetical protein